MAAVGEALTSREKEVLAIILRKIRARGYPPSLREIGQEMGFRSIASVHEYLQRLEEKGYLRRDAAKPRAMEVLDPSGPVPPPETVDLPVFARLDPAKPLWAEENCRGTFVLPRDFLGEGTFFGLALPEDHLGGDDFRAGDMVIVRRQAAARAGDVVVASEGDALRVIRHPDGVPPRDTRLAGKLVALVRRLG